MITECNNCGKAIEWVGRWQRDFDRKSVLVKQWVHTDTSKKECTTPQHATPRIL